MAWTYILHSFALNQYYVGHTEADPQVRLRKHLSEHRGFTGKAKDWKIVFTLEFETKPETVPDNDLAWANLAQAYLNISQFEASRSAAEKALAISPDDIQANNLIGLYGLSKGDVVKAVSVFQAALKREPSNPSAYYYLAMIAQREGNNQAALNLLMKAIQSGPTFKLAYELSARIYESMGNQAAAQRFRATMQQIK